jgi:hypothetical protein
MRFFVFELEHFKKKVVYQNVVLRKNSRFFRNFLWFLSMLFKSIEKV